MNAHRMMSAGVYAQILAWLSISRRTEGHWFMETVLRSPSQSRLPPVAGHPRLRMQGRSVRLQDCSSHWLLPQRASQSSTKPKHPITTMPAMSSS